MERNGTAFVPCKHCQKLCLAASAQSGDCICARCQLSRRGTSKRNVKSESTDQMSSSGIDAMIPVSSRAKKVLQESLENNQLPIVSAQPKIQGSQKSLMEALEADAQCSICLELYAKPVTLNECGHAFCFLCLRADVAKRMDSELLPSCPTCRHAITVAPSAPIITIENIVRTIVSAKSKCEKEEHFQRLKDAEVQVGNILEKCGQDPWQWFKHSKPVFDADDQVYRCPACVWELTSSGRCTNPQCGRAWKLDNPQEHPNEEDAAWNSGPDVDNQEDDDSHLSEENDYDSQDSFICDEPDSAPSDEDSTSNEDSETMIVESHPKQHRSKRKDPSSMHMRQKSSKSKINGSDETSEVDDDVDEDNEVDSDEELSVGAKMLKDRRRAIEAAKKAKLRAERRNAKKEKLALSKAKHGNDKERTKRLRKADTEQSAARRSTGDVKKGGEKKRPRHTKNSEEEAEEEEEEPIKRPSKRSAQDAQRRTHRRGLSDDDDDDDDEKGAREVPDRGGSAAAVSRRKAADTAISGMCDDEDEENAGREEEEEGGDGVGEEEGQEEREEEEEEDEPCRVCGLTGDPGETLLCDGCDGAYHMACVGVEELPGGDWYCRPCRRARRRLVNH